MTVDTGWLERSELESCDRESFTPFLMYWFGSNSSKLNHIGFLEDRRTDDKENSSLGIRLETASLSGTFEQELDGESYGIIWKENELYFEKSKAI